MYSSYWTPKDGRQSTVLTDHEALHRDEATHRSIQSDETVLRPIDLETVMSSKAAVKFWYLHRPKTMEYVHKNATKIQSLGRAFAVRQLKKKHGTEYVVALAKADAVKKEAEKLAELSEAERQAKAEADAEYDARVEESRRQRREQEERERAAELALRQKLAEEEREREEARRAEQEKQQQEEQECAAVAAAALAAEEAARKLAEEQEAIRLAELKKVEEEEAARLADIKRQEEEEAARLAEIQRQEEEEAVRIAAIKQAEEEEAARFAAEQEALRLTVEREEQARFAAAEEAARVQREEKERARAAAALAAQKAAEEAEQVRLAALEAEKNEKYEQSLSKDVPVVVRGHGPGRVVLYEKDNECYDVKLEQAMGGLRITVKASDVNLDDDRILSPRTKVDTPFGTGEVVGLDPHVGCYAINTEINAPDGEQFLAFVQIADVAVHVEEVEERAIVENASMPIPDEIGLVSARIVDSRVVNRTGKKFIQYKLEIRTTNYGTVYCWKRYSTFRSLCERLQKEAGYSKKEIPELPKRHITGNFSQQTIGGRAEKLNLFLNAAVKAEHLQWGIRVDDQIAVYKRRVKRPGDASSESKRAQTSQRSGGLFSSRRR